MVPELEVELLVTRAERKRRNIASGQVEKTTRTPRVPGEKRPKQPRVIKALIRSFPWTKHPEMAPPCTTCPLNRGRWVLAEGDMEKAKLIIVLDAPSPVDVTSERPVTGPVGDEFRKLLVAAGLNIDEILFTYLAKCRALNETEDVVDEASSKCAAHFLRSEIAASTSKHIMLCGGTALSHILDLNSVGFARGKVYPVEGRSIIPTFHPYVLKGDPEEALLFKKDIQLVAELVAGGKGIEYDYKGVYSTADFEAAMTVLMGAEELFFDLETNTLDPWDPGARIVSLAISYTDYQAYFFPTTQALFDKWGFDLNLDQMLMGFKALFERAVRRGGHACKFDVKFPKVLWGINIDEISADSVISQYLLDSRLGTRGLDSLAWEYLGSEALLYDELVIARIKKGEAEQIGLEDIEKLKNYNCPDADFSRRIAHILDQKVAETNQTYALTTVLLPAIVGFADVEIAGMQVDVPALISYRDNEIKPEYEAILEKLKTFCPKPEEANFSSNPYKSHLLYDVWKLPVLSKTAKKKPQVDEAALEKLIVTLKKTDPKDERIALLNLILEYQEKEKLISTYVEGWLRLIKSDGRLHCNYNLDVTETGRTSSSDPNLQNVPTFFRKFIISRWPGGKIVQGDYKQAEVRVAALLSGDENLKELFRQGKDPYRYIASLAYKKSEEEVTDIERDRSKPALLARMYLGQAETIAMELKITTKEAEALLSVVDAQFPGVGRYAEKVKKEVLKTRKIVFPFTHRVRKFSKYDLESAQERIFRRAVNAPHQGIASDLTVLSLLYAQRLQKHFNMQSLVIANVHDNVSNDCPAEEAQQMAEILHEIMSNPVADWVDIPMRADIYCGDNWASKTKVKFD